MNQVAFSLLKAKDLIGSYDAIGMVCGVSGKAVMKWVRSGRLPRTEYTGETAYAYAIELATSGAITANDLMQDPSVSLTPKSAGRQLVDITMLRQQAYTGTPILQIVNARYRKELPDSKGKSR